MRSGGTPLTSVRHYFAGDIPWASISDMTRASKYLRETERCLSQAGLDNSTAQVFPSGTLLYAMYASIGECVIAQEPMATSQAILGIQAGPRLSIEFLYYALSLAKEQVQYLGQQGTQANLNKRMVQDLQISLPALLEQELIASALAATDALIQHLDVLIAKKRNVSAAIRHDLLTGVRQLPGFSDGWPLVCLGEIGATYGGLSGKTGSDFGHGQARYIPFTEIMSRVVLDPIRFEFVDVRRHEKNQNRVQCGDVFFNGSSETPEELGIAAVLTQHVEDTYLNSFSIGFRIKDRNVADPYFLAYFFRSDSGRTAMRYLAQGSTRYNLSKAGLKKTRIPLPPLGQQRAIAAVLRDVDTEIAGLEAEREKTMLIKQGMMQALLSGEVRLPLDDVVVSG